MIRTRDGGQHWETLSHQFLQRMQVVDNSHGYGTVADEFFRTDNGGRSWVKKQIPDISFIERMFFLTPDIGWIAGTHGKDLLVFRTINGGSEWKSPERLHRNRRNGCVIYFSSTKSTAGLPFGIKTVRAPIYIPRFMEESVGLRILIHLFKGRTGRQTLCDLLPEKEASSFSSKVGCNGLRARRMGGSIGISRPFLDSSMIARCSQEILGVVLHLDFRLLTLHPN